MRGEPAPRARSRPVSLDALNFLLADVRGALGPYLNIFLVTQQGWSQSSVGLVTAIAGLVGLAAQAPAGAAIDATPAKRGALVVALTVLACGAIVIFAAPSFWPVLSANTLIAVVGDVFGPIVAALTFATLAILAVLSIPAAAIDHGRACGAEPSAAAREDAGWRTVLECRPLAIYAACTMLFHFANAPLLPLVGQKLAFATRNLRRR